MINNECYITRFDKYDISRSLQFIHILLHLIEVMKTTAVGKIRHNIG